MQRSILLAASLSAFQGVSADDILWVQGTAGQNCDQACRAVEYQCLHGNWPSSALSTFDAVSQATVQPCDAIDTVVDSAQAPFVDVVNSKRTCTYDTKASGAAPKQTCLAAPADEKRRICPCVQKMMQWSLAAPGESCSSHCEEQGGFCGDDFADSMWPKAAEEVKAIAIRTGMRCASVAEADTFKFGEPYFAGTDTRLDWQSRQCVFVNTAPEAQKGFCSAITLRSHQRFCPCYDV
jgi:hypothetical protein